MSYLEFRKSYGNPRRKFAKIYDKYVNKIYRFIFLKVDSQETAEDLTSQVFTKGWERISKINPSTSLRIDGEQSRTIKNQKSEIRNIPAYLYQIARAEISNHYRRGAKFQIISTEANPITDSQLTDPQPTAEESFKLQSDIEIMKASLSQLNDDYQNVIIWRYLDGFSFKQIGQIMERPEGTVRVMVHRALKELREKMEQ